MSTPYENYLRTWVKVSDVVMEASRKKYCAKCDVIMTDGYEDNEDAPIIRCKKCGCFEYHNKHKEGDLT